MKFLRLILLPVILCATSLLVAQPYYVFQSEDPVANYAWDENDTSRYQGHYRYEYAYRLIEEMLTDKRPLDFAEAVFAVENSMYDDTLDYAFYTSELDRIATGIRRMATTEISAPTRDVALNYAIYIYFTQPCPLNHNHPFEYDQLSFIEDIGLTGGMVTHLLRTGKGTCHSLPYLYRIIADRVGTKAYIAIAPLHCYIRHQDAEGNWWNFETTTGTFSHSSFIMEHYYVNEDAIRSGLYMTNLTDKETIVQCLYDLLCFYERKTGFYSNDFVRRCYTLGLRYHYPDCLHKQKIDDLKYQLDKKAWLKGLRSEDEIMADEELKTEYEYLHQQILEFNAMGYHAYTPEEYLEKYRETIEYMLRKNKNLFDQ